MTLAIACRVPEGIVLAADSRITIKRPTTTGAWAYATFDNAKKLFRVKGQEHIGVLTYGVGSIGASKLRTAYSFVEEFENFPYEKKDLKRFSVLEFSKKFGDFFSTKWDEIVASSDPSLESMNFIIAGFDTISLYGSIFELNVPFSPEPKELHRGDKFTTVYGGQQEIVDCILKGYDPEIFKREQYEKLGLSDSQKHQLTFLLNSAGVQVPFSFLPLQDATTFLEFLIETTIKMQKWQIGIPTVGGHIDIATITRSDGIQLVKKEEKNRNDLNLVKV